MFLSASHPPFSNAMGDDLAVKHHADAMGPVATGTTIMAAVFDGGVVMAADTRTSIGQYVSNRASRKISQLHHKIFVARSGSAADTQALTEYVKMFLRQNAIERGTLPTVNTAASLMQLLCYQNKNHLTAGTIVAGWDPLHGAQIYQIPLGGSKIQTNYAIGGSGSGYIAAYVEAGYKDHMTRDECFEFVKRSVSHAISCDGSSGGMIRLFVISESDVEEYVVTGDALPVGP